ncbi:MAG: choice-of-anchor B family protein, partial [Myxococcales bacterium]|nr:choice-of-anchor B family protein [Myxococcales bacterium]
MPLHTLIVYLLVAVVGAGLSALPARAHHPDHLACQTKERLGGRLFLRACAHAEPLEAGEHGARHFLDHHAAGLGLQPGLEDLLLVDERQSTAGFHTRFQQTLNGIPVYDSSISVNQDADGALQSLYSDYRALAPGNPLPDVSSAEARVVAREAAGVEATRLTTASELVWYPRDNGSTALAWKLVVYAATPLGDFLSLVDAHDGKLLLQENRIAFETGSGFVYQPNPMQSSGDTSLVDNGDATSASLDAERVSVTLQGLDAGVATLKGEFVDLVSLAGGKSVPDAEEGDRVYEYDRSDPKFEQVVIYHTIDSMQRYFHSLGFDDDVGAANGIRDFPTLAHAHWYEEDQSFYSTGDDALHFGDGGVDDGEDADIIAHEYGHAVQHDQNSCWGGGEMGAMGDGFGDYLAASFYAGSGDATYQGSNAACVGDWDASSYSGTTPPCLRRVDGNKQYPGDLTGSVHADGEIWSRALWDIRAVLGATTADQLVLEHHFHLPCSATMVDAANEFLQADVNLNGGFNDAAIRAAFCDRGILSGEGCSPPSGLMLGFSVSPDPAETGQPATYTLVATNTSNALQSGIALSASVPAGSSYVAGSASDGGSEAAGSVSWPALDLAAGAQATRSFQVQVAAGPGTQTLFEDDMELGQGAWLASHDEGAADWTRTTTNPHNPKAHLQPVYAKSASCDGGAADIYPCENVDLLAYLPTASIGGGDGNDGWGWTDPLDGKEYVLSGRSSGTSFLDISDPANPIYLGDLPTHSFNSDWRDMKVYDDHAFIVSEAPGHGMQVFDLAELRSVANPPVTFTASAHYADFSNAHNIAINTDTGFAYVVGTNTCGAGLHMVDIRNPSAPVSAGCYAGDGYT